MIWLQILRDQRGLGNKDVGMGNQLSVNQLIAHHSVVFKPDSLLVWVSAGPWQEGKFICYDLKKIFNLDITRIKENKEIYTASRTIPADTFLNSAELQAFQGISEHDGTTGRLHKNANSPFRRILMKHTGKPIPRFILLMFTLRNIMKLLVYLTRHYPVTKPHFPVLCPDWMKSRS